MSNISESLRMGVSRDYLLWKPTIGLLRAAELPVRGLGFKEEAVLFNKNVSALRRPKGEEEFALELVPTFDLAPGYKLDLAIASLDSPRRTFNTVAVLELPGEEKGATVPAVLLSADFIPESILEAESLSGVAGFRNRLVAKLVRASRQTANQAELERQRRKGVALVDSDEMFGFRRYFC